MVLPNCNFDQKSSQEMFLKRQILFEIFPPAIPIFSSLSFTSLVNGPSFH